MRALANGTVVLLAALLAASPAFATGGGGGSCSATLGTISPVPMVVYDPFDGASESVVFTVELKNTGSDSCTLALAISSPASSGGTRYFRMGSQKLRYVVETTSGDDYENDLGEPRGSHSVGGGNTKTVTVQVKVPSGLISPAGDYADMLRIRLYKSGGSALGTAVDVPATAKVERRAQVNIAGASSTYGLWSVDEIDFNNLSNGETRTAKVQVRATTGVSIKVASQNLGKLKHSLLSNNVAYAMKLDGQTMDLTDPYDTLVRSPPVSLDGTSYPMVLTIGDVDGRPAGTYKDLLTITVSPQ